MNCDKQAAWKCLLWASVFCTGLIAPALVPAQTREQGILDTNDTPPVQPHTNSSWAPSVPGDALTTNSTAAKAILGPGDQAEVTVFDVPELMQKVRVAADGTITLSLIGQVPVSGLTTTDAAGLIASKLIEGHFVKSPQVSVFVTEYAGVMATVEGEVNHPGAYPLLRSHRLSDLIALAGGFNNKSGSHVTILRADSSQQLDVDLNDPDPGRRNPVVSPGDNITVGLAGIVYVLGDVYKPGGFRLDRRTDIGALEVVALAEGMLPSASPRKAEIIRTEGGKREEIPLDLKAALVSGGADPLMRPGDILYIPTSLLHGMGRLSIQTILATVSGVAIYATVRN